MIRSVSATNFKCFERIQVPFSALTLLSGLNGSGKSSIIQTLLLLRQSFEQHVLLDTGLALNGELVCIGTARDALYEGASSDQIEFNVDSNEGSVSFLFNYDIPSRNIIPIQPTHHFFPVPGHPLFKSRLFYLSADRAAPQLTYPINDFAARQQRILGRRGEYTAHFLSLYGDATIIPLSASHPRAMSSSLKHQVEAWLGEITPGTRLHVTPLPDMDVVQLQFSFPSGQITSSNYRPTNVGFGLSYTLPVITACLAADQDTIVIIENPESHLHPMGQAKLGELLATVANEGIQIIIETHSDHILNGIRTTAARSGIAPERAAIHFLSRNGETGIVSLVSPTLDSRGRLSQWPDGFFDQWDRSLMELI